MMENQNEDYPNQWKCPITQQLMNDPVIADDGFSYQKLSIENWFKTSKRSPLTGLSLQTTRLIHNRALKQTIEQFLQKIKIKKKEKQIAETKKRLQQEIKKNREKQLVQNQKRIYQEIKKTREKQLVQNQKRLYQEIKKNREKQLVQNQKRLQEIKKKQAKVEFDKKYGKYFTKLNCQMWLYMDKLNVTDQMVKEIAQSDLSGIQCLALGNNQITDQGFNLLFQNREWPVLEKIGLSQNKIQNIHSLHKLANLQVLSIYKNELSEASCTYLCSNSWPKMRILEISFKKGLNNKCWEKLMIVLPQKFPKMENLASYQKVDITKDNLSKLQSRCNSRKITLHLW